MKKRYSVLIVALIVLVACMLGGCQGSKKNQYEKAVALMYEEKYSEAAVIFEELGDHLNSQELFKECENRMFAEALQGKWTRDDIYEGNRIFGMSFDVPVNAGPIVYEFSGNNVKYSYPEPSFVYDRGDWKLSSNTKIIECTGTFEVSEGRIKITSSDPGMSTPLSSFENGELKLYTKSIQNGVELLKYFEKVS